MYIVKDKPLTDAKMQVRKKGEPIEVKPEDAKVLLKKGLIEEKKGGEK